MFHTFAIPISWTELLKRTGNQLVEDNVLGLAAQMAYYFLLALVPAILCVVALASLAPVDVLQGVVQSLEGFAPPEVVSIVDDQLRQLSQREDQGLLTFGLLFALWSSSVAMVAVVDALNRAYDIDESRPWWKVRLTAILLTIGIALFAVVAFALVLAGPALADRVAEMAGFGPVFTWSWKILQWPVVFMLVALGVGLVYYFAPDAEQDWEWITPGAVLATALWLVASLGFRIYVGNFADYNETYGSLGGVIILMLWFYISGLAVLVGAEMNAEIEHASPHGKDPGEKVPGEKKKIGCAAKRAWEERQERPQSPPSGYPQPQEERPAEVPAAAFGELDAQLPRPSFTAYVVLAAGLIGTVFRGKRGKQGA